MPNPGQAKTKKRTKSCAQVRVRFLILKIECNYLKTNDNLESTSNIA